MALDDVAQHAAFGVEDHQARADLLKERKAVVKVSERLVGMVVLRSMSLVITPPLVSMPRDSGDPGAGIHNQGREEPNPVVVE